MATINGTDGQDELYGTSDDDSIFGFDGDDTIYSSPGRDNIHGGFGIDRVFYLYSPTGVTVILGGFGNGGDAEGDFLQFVQLVSGSLFDDRLIGQSIDLPMEGRAGIEDLHGNVGNDVLYGLHGDDYLSGDDGNDRLVGGAGADSLGGDGGLDWAYYHTSPAGVTVNLATGVASGGDAAGDRLYLIESLYGSAFADNLTGSAGNNLLVGAGGSDLLRGGAGADIFVYETTADSTLAARDAIADFGTGDKIDLQPIDADGNTGNGNTAFTFTAGGVFTGIGHEVIVQGSGSVYTVLADVNGDMSADMAISVASPTAPVAGDLLL